MPVELRCLAWLWSVTLLDAISSHTAGSCSRHPFQAYEIDRRILGRAGR